MNGARIMVKSLEDLKVERIFGYSGATILPVFHELGKSSIEITINANEQTCAFAAAGYSRSSEKVGVAVVTSGPAITNTLTAVADSNADSIPLLVFAGQVPCQKLGTDEFQHINVKRVFAEACKKVLLVTKYSNIEEIVKDAYYFAKSGKPGPVVIDFPFDVQQEEDDYNQLEPEIFKRKYDNENHLGRNQCREFFDLLQGARKPLLYVGGGLNSKIATDRLREFNRMFEIPSINSLMGKGTLDESLDSSLGMLGMYGTPYANTAIQETDLFVAFGVRWDDRVAQKVGESGLDADIAYFDINAEKVQEVRVSRQPKFSFIGDAATILADLLEYAKAEKIGLDIGEWQEKTRRMKQEMRLDYHRNAEAIQQAEVIDMLSELISENTKITTGVGNHQMLAAQYLKMPQPKSFLTSGGFGTMGFALPSAIGAYFANPESTVIAIDGDGSIKMNMGAMHTIGSLKLPIKVLLLNNHSEGMVRNIQTLLYDRRHVGTEREYDTTNFSLIARECGFSFHDRISQRADLKPAMEDFLAASGPSFLEIITDIEEIVYPRIPAGKGYPGMILGPYIKKAESY
jgi:acetolactate synthase-1/2/3 large subunit